MQVSAQSMSPYPFRTGPSNALLDKSKYFGPCIVGGTLSKSHNNVPYSADEHRARKPGEIYASSSVPYLQSWDSEAQSSSRSTMPPPTLKKLLPKSDVKQESVKDLANFLKNREPPRDNFMSIPDSDGSSLNSAKNSPFHLFGRRKQRKCKKYKKARLLRLPDSAVAAKTRSGKVHIAISIPVQYDHVYSGETPTSASPAKPTNGQNHSALKPLLETRESSSTINHQGENLATHSSQESMQYPIVVPGPESPRPLWSLYRSPHDSQLNGTSNSSGAAKSGVKVGDTPRGQRRYVAVSPTGLLGGGGFHTFVQNAAGGVPNMKNSAAGVSPGRSNTTLTSVTYPDFGQLPPRLSSIPPSVPLSLEASLLELQHELDFNTVPAPPPTTSLPTPPNSSSPSNSTHGRSTGPYSPMIFGTATARMAHTYHKTHVELHTISRPHSPRLSNASSIAAGPGPGEPPKRKLPDLPIRRSEDSRRVASSASGSFKDSHSARSVMANEGRKKRVVNVDGSCVKETEVEIKAPKEQDTRKDSCHVLTPATPSDHHKELNARKDSFEVLTPTISTEDHKELDTRKDSCHVLTPITPTAPPLEHHVEHHVEHDTGIDCCKVLMPSSPAPSLETNLSRQERVRQRKMRDIRNSRTLSGASQADITEIVNAHETAEEVTSLPTTAESKASLIDASRSSLRERRFKVPPALVLSPILQVAWLPPYEGQVLETDLQFASLRIPPKNPRRNTSPNTKTRVVVKDESEEHPMPRSCPSCTEGTVSDESDAARYEKEDVRGRIFHERGEKEKVRWRGSWNDTWSTTPRPLRYPSRGRSGFRPSEQRLQSPSIPTRTPSHSPQSPCSPSSSPSCSPSPLSHSLNTRHTHHLRTSQPLTETTDHDTHERSMSESRRKLERKRRERRMRRNISLQLRELEDRVRRMERENRECRLVREVVVGVVRGLEGRV